LTDIFQWSLGIKVGKSICSVNLQNSLSIWRFKGCPHGMKVGWHTIESGLHRPGGSQRR